MATPVSVRVGIYRVSERGLIRVAIQDTPESASVEADAWRVYTRSNALPQGDYEVHRLGRKYHMEERMTYQSTDLGVVK